MKKKTSPIIVILVILVFIFFIRQKGFIGGVIPSTTPLSINDITKVEFHLQNPPPRYVNRWNGTNYTQTQLYWEANFFGEQTFGYFYGQSIYNFDINDWVYNDEPQLGVSKNLVFNVQRSYSTTINYPEMCWQVGDYINITHNLGNTIVCLPEECVYNINHEFSVADDGSTYYGKTIGTLAQACCVEEWTCTSWSTCTGGVQTRTCTDNNACGTTANKPPEQQVCGAVDCNIVKQELGTKVFEWVQNQIGRDELGIEITEWVNC